MDRKRAIEKLNDIRCHVKETSAEEQSLVMAIEALKEPEIVRCGECRHKSFCPSKIDCGDGLYYTIDFCSNGKRAERRSDE